MTQSWGETLGAATSSAFGVPHGMPQHHHKSARRRTGGHHHHHKQQKKEVKTKRTRRGGRGRSRRRGAMEVYHYDEQYPWWYATMAQSGLTPEGVEPTPEDGFPVILPSCQAVYILPTAVNPHRAATYVPYVTDDDDDDDANSESSAKSADAANPAPEVPDFDLDILKVARMRSVTFNPELDEDDDDRPQLKVSFSFLDINDDDNDDDDDASVTSEASTTSSEEESSASDC